LTLPATEASPDTCSTLVRSCPFEAASFFLFAASAADVPALFFPGKVPGSKPNNASLLDFVARGDPERV
jgi:hypothetical protein